MSNISSSASLKNSKLCSSQISIEKGASLTDVEIKAKEIVVKAGATLTGCKIFSDGNIMIGENTTIKERTIINAFKSVSLGDNVGVGGYCLIFTHSAWQNVLEGNPYKFADVEIKDNSWLPWNVTVLPGVTIEKDATIGSGSTVTRSIPQSVFAAGVPAKVIRQKNTGQLSLEEKKLILEVILKDFYQYAVNFLKLEHLRVSQEGDWTIEYKNTRLIYALDSGHLGQNDTILSFKVPDSIKKQNKWIELDSKRSNSFDDLAIHFISFVRRYGIKIITEN